ncbi:MAG: DUF721 domain-containing protein [Paludibacteraceae bacterium]|nr:DUF721 domain-containing protein [Paludibacteraceae bacterium]
MKKQNTMTLGDAISLWADTMKLRQKIDETRMISSWGQVVGSYIESKTRNIYVKNRVLYVQIDSSVVRNELLLAKASLLRQLNGDTSGGSLIDDIIFR